VVERLEKLLKEENIYYKIYDGVVANPPIQVVEKSAELTKEVNMIPVVK